MTVCESGKNAVVVIKYYKNHILEGCDGNKYGQKHILVTNV